MSRSAFMVKLAGSNVVTATGGATTLTIAEAVLPFRLAVMPACRFPGISIAPGALHCRRGVHCVIIAIGSARKGSP
jgi:hypothetical protein